MIWINFFNWRQNMSRRSGSRSTISITTIIFWAFLGYMWFGGDDSDDKKRVEIREQQSVVEQTTNNEDIDLTKLKDEGSRVVNQLLDKAKQKINEVKKDTDENKPDPKEEQSPVMVAEPDTKPKEESPLKPEPEKNPEMEMKKL